LAAGSGENDHLLPALNFSEPLSVLEASSVLLQTFITPHCGAECLAGVENAKTMAVEGNRTAEYMENSSAGVSAGSEGPRGRKKGRVSLP
jgi:hypothetical protein